MILDVPKLFVNWEIVVVDDDGDSLEVACRLLRLAGAIVYCAANGQVGLEVTREIMPRFILTDLSMPVMDGWAMLYYLKQDSVLKQIPVIVLSAHAMQGDQERALSVGFSGYVTKPIDPFKFIHQLAHQLRIDTRSSGSVDNTPVGE